jgi:hypothetical protein
MRPRRPWSETTLRIMPRLLAFTAKMLKNVAPRG